ncbi:MAG: NifB/NifX family molybdenum-iron cluster-binding protein [Deltaproteobacteria bacterium]|nr:NifB/NifX family molybdenum-iron cluster-binding protein [Deltaproteobacteria bacterium]MBW2339911.1 NifB/NifX family molybdenum-iron cluster-binding protein [Deltaproteobacteria bacterium]
MILAFSTDDNSGLEAVLSHHFGRCPYYTLVDVQGAEIKDVRSAPNPFYDDHGEPGEVPSFIRSQGAQVIIAGGMGPRAISFFEQFGIQAITGASGRVKDVVEVYLKGSLAGAEPCNESEDTVSSHPGKTPLPGQLEGDEMSRLKEEMAALRRHLAEAQDNIARLERKKR